MARVCDAMHQMEDADPTQQVSTGTVYSLHKSATRAHVARVASSELHAASAQVLAQLHFDLPASYAFHRHGQLLG